jgi:iodotyrosine deiodinase
MPDHTGIDSRKRPASLTAMSPATYVRPESWFDPGLGPEQAARQFYQVMRLRRSVRMFSDRPVSQETVEWLIRTAGSAPSGANKQPWRFVCVNDPYLKRQIRLAAEQEEREFYQHRANSEWLEDLRALGTDENKAFLEIAPWLIVVFKLAHADDASQVYYVNESVGIAAGMLLAAAQHAGLATLTHTPSPMKFLARILGRPDNERPFLLIPLGYPAEDLTVPLAAISRKPLEQIMIIDRPENPAAE